MNGRPMNVWPWMIAIAVVAAVAATLGVIAFYRYNRRHGIHRSFWSPSLPGWGLLDLWSVVAVASVFIPSGIRWIIVPGIFVAGLIAAVFRYALALRDCMRSDWDWAAWLGQVWYFGEVLLFILSSVYGINVVRSRGLTYEMLALPVIAGGLAPLFVRRVYIRYVADLEYEQTYQQQILS